MKFELWVRKSLETSSGHIIFPIDHSGLQRERKNFHELRNLIKKTVDLRRSHRTNGKDSHKKLTIKSTTFMQCINKNHLHSHEITAKSMRIK